MDSSDNKILTISTLLVRIFLVRFSYAVNFLQESFSSSREKSSIDKGALLALSGTLKEQVGDIFNLLSVIQGFSIFIHSIQIIRIVVFLRPLFPFQ